MAFRDKEQITFLLSSQCNLHCRYCYMPKLQSQADAQQLDPEFAAIGLRDFFRSSPSRTIRFFAPGEPTAAFPLMKKIWDDAKSLAGDSLRTELETNGYFGPAIADWIEKHVDYLWISSDGPSEVQDAQRPTAIGLPSSPIVHANIQRFARAENMQIGVRATLEREWISRQVELVEYFHGLGIKYLAASPMYYSSQNPSVVTPSLFEFAKGFVPAYFRAKELGMCYLTLMTVNFDEPVDIYCQASIPTPRLTTDGYVSSCDWAAFGDKFSSGDNGAQLIYGRYDRHRKAIDYDSNKIAALQRRHVDFLSSGFCKGCVALRHCAGGCVGKMMAATSDLYKASEDWCNGVRYLFEHLPVNSDPYPVFHP